MKSATSRPQWFDASKYINLTPEGWFQAIRSRLPFTSEKLDFAELEGGGHFDHFIKQQFVSVLDRHPSLDDEIVVEDYTPVRPLKISEGRSLRRWLAPGSLEMEALDESNSKAERIKELMGVFEQIQNSSEHDELDRLMMEFVNGEDTLIGMPPGMELLSIDLDSNTTELVKEFKNYIQRRKQELTLKSRSKISPATLQNWHTAGVIPYFDLTTAARLGGKPKYTQYELADWLWPDANFDAVGRLTHATYKYFPDVFKQPTLNQLQLLIRTSSS